MQMDFHYYATYCAAVLAGWSHEESLDIACSAQFVDCCSATLLKKLKGPSAAATMQLQLEMMDYRTDLLGLQEITRIWSSFHFLPGDLYAEVKKGSFLYKNKYRLICGPNGKLLEASVHLAKDSSLQAAGIAMHVLADTWAHRYFAGTPSLVINNTDDCFYELSEENGTETEKKIHFRNNPKQTDSLEERKFTGSLFQVNETSIMNLGHGRAGHLPDYSCMRYKYLPAWAEYHAVLKDNPEDYRLAFCQMIKALKFLRGAEDEFCRETYDFEAVAPYEDEIRRILTKRQLIACEDWRNFGEKLSGREIREFDTEAWQKEYCDASETDRDDTPLGRFFIAAMKQKSMVTREIFASGNLLAGISVAPELSVKALKDYLKVINGMRKEGERK